MSERADILIFGTGSFAARILFDLAATADLPTRIVIAGRRPERLAWLETAARARAHMFARTVSVATAVCDLSRIGDAGELIETCKPRVVLQVASLQSAAVISGRGNAWTRLVAEGGLSATGITQAVLSSRVARAVRDAAPTAHLVNGCFPDVVNGLIAAQGLPITCGIGNVQILAHAFAGALGAHSRGKLRVLAQYQCLADWRRAPRDRKGPRARAWLGEAEIEDIYALLSGVQLTPEPVIDVSGAAGAPILMALAHGRDWSGHAPGPGGWPGGYPIYLQGGRLGLDLPPGLSEGAAVAWNAGFEAANGLICDGNGAVQFTGKLRDLIAAENRTLALGFPLASLEDAHGELLRLRERLEARP